MTERDKQRALVYACLKNLDKARELLREHPDWRGCRDGIGETALHYLVIENRLPAVQLLHEAGSSVDEPDDFGTTPLMHAIQLNHRELVDWLLTQHASIEPMDKIGNTALSLATKNERAWAFQRIISLPRQRSIDSYYDDDAAEDVFLNPDLVMYEHLIKLGLTRR